MNILNSFFYIVSWIFFIPSALLVLLTPFSMIWVWMADDPLAAHLRETTRPDPAKIFIILGIFALSLAIIMNS